jgi:putative transposase
MVTYSVLYHRLTKQLLEKVHQERLRFPRLIRIWVDAGFSGENFLHLIMDRFSWILDVVLRPNGS